LCDDYWNDATQALLGHQQQLNVATSAVRDFADFEVEVGEEESPTVWRAVSLHGYALPPNSEVFLRIQEGDILLRSLMRDGRRLRLVDALLMEQPDDEHAAPIISLQRVSEAFVV